VVRECRNVLKWRITLNIVAVPMNLVPARVTAVPAFNTIIIKEKFRAVFLMKRLKKLIIDPGNTSCRLKINQLKKPRVFPGFDFLADILPEFWMGWVVPGLTPQAGFETPRVLQESKNFSNARAD